MKYLLATLCALTALTLPGMALAEDAPPRVPSGVQDYSLWTGFKEGAWCKHESIATNGGVQKKSMETFTLKSIAADKLVVQRETVVTDAKGVENKSITRTTLTPPKSPQATQGSEVTQGDEELKVKDQVIACHFFKVVSKRDKMSHTWTIWISPKVPGGVVKQTGQTSNDGKVVTTLSDTLIDFKGAP